MNMIPFNYIHLEFRGFRLDHIKTLNKKNLNLKLIWLKCINSLKFLFFPFKILICISFTSGEEEKSVEFDDKRLRQTRER